MVLAKSQGLLPLRAATILLGHTFMLILFLLAPHLSLSWLPRWLTSKGRLKRRVDNTLPVSWCLEQGSAAYKPMCLKKEKHSGGRIFPSKEEAMVQLFPCCIREIQWWWWWISTGTLFLLTHGLEKVAGYYLTALCKGDGGSKLLWLRRA